MGVLTGLTIQAKGGNGGNTWLTTAPGAAPTERHGPGGGGGGGYILLSSAAAATDVSGGTNGLTTSGNDPYGAQPGSIGVVETIAGNNVLPGGDGSTCAVANLAVTNVAGASTTPAGSNVTFTQTVTNNGPSPADGVVYMMPIPAFSTFVSMSVPPPGWTCVTPAAGGTGVVICTTPNLVNGGSANFSLVVNSNYTMPPGYVMSETNSVSSNTSDTIQANNQATATTLIERAFPGFDTDLAITISQSTAYPTASSNIIYTQTISNLGPSTEPTPSYTFTTPPNTTFVSITPPGGWSCPTQPAVGGTGTINCSGGAFASGASVSMPLTLKVTAGTLPGTTITASPSVSSTLTDLYLPNNSASVTATVIAAGAVDVAVTIANSPNPVSPAQTYIYTVVASNPGPNAAATISVSIPLPAGTNFQSLAVPVGWACANPGVGVGGTITCTIASLAPNASATFSPVVQVNPATAPGTVLNITSMITTTSTEGAAFTGNNSASTSNLVTARTNADMAIVKTDSPDPVGPGQLETYRLTVTNNGPAIANNVTASDVLPVNVTFVSANPSVGTCAGSTTITCSLGTLNVGDSAFVNIIVQMPSSPGTINNTATVTATETDPIPANNSSTASTTILAVTLVRLRDFSVTQEKKNVSISWQTSFESDNLGFNIYRDISGQRTKINNHLIAGTALTSKNHDAEAGQAYRTSDKLDDATAFVQYWLEDVDTKGVHTMHGPVSPVGGPPSGPPNTTPLPGLGAGGVEIATPDGFGAARATAQEPASAAQYKQQLDLAADNGLKIYVTQEGWYRLTRAEMSAAGYDPGSNPKAISLYMLGAEQDIVMDDGGDGKFDANDAIEFYGYALDSTSTGARTYWLRASKGDGNNSRVDVSKVKGGDPITGSVPFTYERKERSIFFAALISNGDGDNFLGEIIANETVTSPLKVGNLDPSYGGNATLDLVIQGGTLVPHSIDVSINGHSLGTATLSKDELKSFTFTLPQSWLTTGTNNVAMIALNGDEDLSFLAKSRLTYQHLLRADNGALEVSLAERACRDHRRLRHEHGACVRHHRRAAPLRATDDRRCRSAGWLRRDVHDALRQDDPHDPRHRLQPPPRPD